MPILPTLTTERLLLPQLDRRFAEAAQQLLSDRDIAANVLHVPHPYPSGEALRWIGRINLAIGAGNAYTFAIVRRAGVYGNGQGAAQHRETFIGTVGLYPNTQHGRASLGYWLGKPYWGHGYMTEAVRRILQFGFDGLELRRIEADAFAGNVASIRVMEKCGLRYEATLREHLLKWGEFRDLVRYAVLREEWDDRSAPGR